MIVLDTNVVSELMRAHPVERVELFFKSQPVDAVVTTSITIAEILYGVRRLPPGRRRSELEKGFAEFLSRGFRETLLPFDADAADRYSQLIVDRQRVGRNIEAFDAMIAAIALCRGAAIATRDVADFQDCGVALINPWD
jgi:toxin FitB